MTRCAQTNRSLLTKKKMTITVSAVDEVLAKLYRAPSIAGFELKVPMKADILLIGSMTSFDEAQFAQVPLQQRWHRR